MPEEIEIDTDDLRDKIEEEIEHDGGSLLRTIALSTALFAALAAIVSLQAGSTVNEALVLKTEATRLQAQASDQWSYYQAKGIKSEIARTAQGAWLVQNKTPPAKLAEDDARYTKEQEASKDKALDLEKERDAKSTEADELLHHHHRFAESVAFLQVGIALGAVAALTKSRAAWWGSLLLGLIGAGMFAYGLFAA
jgi:hypothetical protein